MKIASFCCSLSSALFFASCALTVQDRIEANRAGFESLPTNDKAQVAQGQIAKGMTPEAVKIAWGEPDSTSTGLINNQQSERWIYSDGGGSGWSFGIGGGVGAGRSSTGYGLGTGISIPIGQVPPNCSYVLFQNGRVTDWLGQGRGK